MDDETHLSVELDAAQAQVARLEEELAEAKGIMHGDRGAVASQRDVIHALEGRIAEKDTALEAVEITAMRLRSDANVAKNLGYEGGDEAATADELMAIVEPALSGDGKGIEQVRGALQMWDDYNNVSRRAFWAKYPWLNTVHVHREDLMFAFTHAALEGSE